MSRSRRPGREDGALLIEAVMGIGLLLVMTAAVAVIGRAAGDAQARVEAQIAAVDLAGEVLEVGADAATSDAVGDVEPLGVQVVATSDGPVAHGCWSPDAGEGDAVAVRVVATERAGSAPVLLPGRLPTTNDGPGPGGTTVRIHVPSSVAPAVDAIALRRADGALVPAVLVGDGCWRAAVEPGDHRIVATATPGVTLVDATHVPHAIRPPRLSVAGRPLVTRLALRPAATLTVTLDADGARLPDDAGAGLVWTIVGDDRLNPTAPAVARPVHPGRVSATVSTCRNAAAPGSTVRVDLAPGEVVSVAVPLATLEVEGVGAAGDEVLAAYSTSGCDDGSTRRPVLRWEGALADGMRVALPHGMWQFRLETATGSRLTSPVTVRAGGVDRTVAL